MSGVSNCFTFDNLIIFGVKNHKPFAMPKMLCYHFLFTCYCYFHHCFFLQFFILNIFI